MSTRLNQFVCGAAALLCAIPVSQAQLSSPAPLSSPTGPAQVGSSVPDTRKNPAAPAPAPVAPVTGKAADSSMIECSGRADARDFSSFYRARA